MNDEEADCDDILFGCALRKDDLPAFLADFSKLVAAYGGADFSELLENDVDDAVIASARRRWFADVSKDVVDGACRIIGSQNAQ